MMSLRLFSSLLLIAMVSPPVSMAGQNTAPAAQSSNAPSAAAKADPTGSRFVVPAETTVPLELKNALSSRTAYAGQAIYCETIYPITVHNRIVIPVGSYVKGSVTQVIRPGRVKGRAQIGLRFDSITLPDGTTRQMRATLSSFAGNGNEGFRRDEAKVEGASSKKEDAATVAQTTVTGAEIGGITGAVRGAPGKGLAIGSATGALGGLIWVLATRGKDILLPPGTSLELQLSAPLNFEENDFETPARYQEGPALPHREP